MKIFFLFFAFALFILTNVKAADETYSFVKNFELVSARMLGNHAVVRVKHPRTWNVPRFELVPSACRESHPAQCGGVLVRLDMEVEDPEASEWQVSEVKINVVKIFGGHTDLAIRGPHGKQVSVKF